MRLNGVIAAIVVDIEGTICPLAFVKETLFPYAEKHLKEFVRRHAEKTFMHEILESVRNFENIESLTPDEASNILLLWMKQDKKITPLKTLQGHIWREGYEKGHLHSRLYPDALQNLQKWHKAGIPLYVYSSGSIAAQKLLFAHSADGDLTSLFMNFFDTTSGNKLESVSYLNIEKNIGLPGTGIYFFSDNSGELDAARNANWKTIFVDRSGFGGSDHPTIHDFNQIILPEE